MTKFARILFSFLMLPTVALFAQGEHGEKLPPLLKERRSGKVMFNREQAVREINREKLNHSSAVFAKWGGKLCPAFAANDLEGREWTNEKIRGKVTLINFWHSESAPCVREIPWFNKLMRKYPQANFLACTFHTPEQIKKVVTETPFLYPQLADATALWNLFGVTLSPTMILLDEEGRVTTVVTGVGDALKRTVEAKLKELHKE